MREIKYIVLHCSATSQLATVEAIKSYWRVKLGWKSPGYHLIVKPDGEVVQLLSFDKISNGVKGYNSESINVCYIGGKDVDDRTEAQKKSLQNIVEDLRAKYPKAEVLGHRDFPKVAKACPRFDARTWAATFMVVMALLLGGCSANWHLKKAIGKDPAILKQNVVRIDTTVITKERILHDTVVMNDVDSVVIEKDRVITKIWRVHDTLRVQTICPGDTVRIEVVKECPPTVLYTPKTWFESWGKWALIALLVFVVLVLLKKQLRL